MTESFEQLSENRVRQLREKAKYDRQTVFDILDAAPVAHVALVQDGNPVVVPMIFGRDGDTLYLHGARKAQREEERRESGLGSVVEPVEAPGKAEEPQRTRRHHHGREGESRQLVDRRVQAETIRGDGRHEIAEREPWKVGAHGACSMQAPDLTHALSREVMGKTRISASQLGLDNTPTTLLSTRA